MLDAKRPMPIQEAREKATFVDEALPANLHERWRDPVFRQELKDLVYKLALETFKSS